MAEQKPIEVTVIGVDGAEKIPDKMEVTTPTHSPNIVVNVIPPILAILVRFFNTFLTTLLGILMGAMATNVITAPDFTDLLFKCAGLSVAGAVVGLIKDLITVFGKLEGKYPLMSGSV